MSSWMRAKVTNVRFTAFSISSTHMNMTSTFLRVSRPTAPITKITAATPRYRLESTSPPTWRPLGGHRLAHAPPGSFLGSGGVGRRRGSVAAAPDEHHGAHHRDDEQHGRDLE